MLDRQKVFDDAIKGLWGQQAFSILPRGGCAYRGENGCKCALGHLIPDENYDKEMEGRGIGTKLVRNAIDDKYGEIREGEDCQFLREIQIRLHDNLYQYPFNPEIFKDAALKFAQEHNLKVDVNLFETTEIHYEIIYSDNRSHVFSHINHLCGYERLELVFSSSRPAHNQFCSHNGSNGFSISLKIKG